MPATYADEHRVILHNGYLPDAVLAPVAGGRLRKDAAARFNAMNVALRAQGHATVVLNGSLSGYRPFAGQVVMRQSWCSRGACGNAAVPGTSDHGWGIAGDANWMSTTQGYITVNHWFDKSCSDAPWESWHRRACGLSATVFAGIPTRPKPHPIAFTLGEKRTVYLLTTLRKRPSTPARRAAIRALKAQLLRYRAQLRAAARVGGWNKFDRRRRYNRLLAIYQGG